MANSKQVRFFDLYSRNWELVKRHPNLRVEPDVSDVFVCPLCIKFFPRDAIDAKAITLEHVPPKKFGGKVRTMTCRECNNWGGSKLESQLGHQLQLIEVLSGQSGSSSDVEYFVNEQIGLPATVHRPNSDTWQLFGDPKRTNPSDLANLYESLKKTDSQSFKLTLRFTSHKARHPEAALLRIAYLLAFSIFGYSFLLNPSLPVLRGQIKHPEITVLPTWGILREDLPEEFLGINVITRPQELRSFLVVFDLKAPQKTIIRYGVIIPGPNEPGLTIYDSLSKQDGNSISFRITKITDTIDFLKEPFVMHDIWESLKSSTNSSLSS